MTQCVKNAVSGKKENIIMNKKKKIKANVLPEATSTIGSLILNNKYKDIFIIVIS